MENTNLIHATVIVEGRCMDLLLGEDEIVNGFKNALSRPDLVPIAGQCWQCQRPDKCSLLDRILNKCCDCKETKKG